MDACDTALPQFCLQISLVNQSFGEYSDCDDPSQNQCHNDSGMH